MSYYFGNNLADDDFTVKEYTFGDRIDAERMNYMNKAHRLSVNYRYLDLNTTNYKFIQEEFAKEEIAEYFRKMKDLCSSTFFDLRDRQKSFNSNDKRLHFYPSNGNSKLHKLIAELFGIKRVGAERMPELYHFALYTKGKADRKTGVKSPRIYFFIGDDATIYPLFFDPYHEINP